LDSHENIQQLSFEDKTIQLVGTAHVSQESADLVKELILENKPDTVCIELCPTRYQSITKKNTWQEMNIINVIKEKKAFLLLVNIFLASLQRKLAKQFDIKPGQEMLEAIKAAEETSAEIVTVDRDIRTTLARTWKLMGLWTKAKLFSSLLFSLVDSEEISKEEIEHMKKRDVLELLLQEMGEVLPDIKKTLIDERDLYMAEKIRQAPGKSIIAEFSFAPDRKRRKMQLPVILNCSVTPVQYKDTRISIDEFGAMTVSQHEVDLMM